MVEYFQIAPDSELPEIARFAKFKALVIVESPVTKEWRSEISKWLVDSGCIYMMAWGQDCSAWDDSVDWAVLEKYDFSDIPDEEFVLTTWHEEIPLEEYFWESKNSFTHSYTGAKIPNTLLIHISTENKCAECLAQYEAA